MLRHCRRDRERNFCKNDTENLLPYKVNTTIFVPENLFSLTNYTSVISNRKKNKYIFTSKDKVSNYRCFFSSTHKLNLMLMMC